MRGMGHRGGGGEVGRVSHVLGGVVYLVVWPLVRGGKRGEVWRGGVGGKASVCNPVIYGDALILVHTETRFKGCGPCGRPGVCVYLRFAAATAVL